MKGEIMPRTFKYYTKAKIDNLDFYFDTYENLHTFIVLFFKSNKNHETICIALSNKSEFELNTMED